MENAKPVQDERVMAGLSHLGILLPMWGLIMSVLIWVTQKDKSDYVRRQAIQAVAWQVAFIGGMFAMMGCYMLSFFGSFGGIFLATNDPSTLDGPPAFFFLPFAVMGCFFMVMLLFIAVGIWGAVRSFQGQMFLYPLLGSRVDNYMMG